MQIDDTLGRSNACCLARLAPVTNLPFGRYNEQGDMAMTGIYLNRLAHPIYWAISCLTIAAVGNLSVSSTARAAESPVIAEQTIAFESAGAVIAGVITRPLTGGPHPAIVLIDGSGPTDRHNMRDFSVALAREGFVALAYDKRGVGDSTGDPDAWRYFSFDDMAADAAAGAGVLATRDDVAKDQIGLLGISQGGWVAPLAATLSDSVSFLVLLSPSVTSVAEDLIFERAARLRAEGFSHPEVAEARQMQELYHEVVRKGEGFSRFEAAWRRNENERWFHRVYLADSFLDPDHEYHRWFATVVDFDPLPYLRELTVPVLWLFGDPDHDRLAPVARSIPNVGSLSDEGKDYTIHQFPGTDHNIMPVGGPADGEGDALPPYAEPLMKWLGQFH